MRRRYPKDCAFFVAELHGADRRAVNEMARKLKSHVVLEQRRADFEPWWVEVLEGRPSVHTNVIAPLPADAAERIALAPAYDGHVHVQPVTDMVGLTKYLLKETTPQAAYKTGVRRLAGSHVLDGGGDRVRLSKALGAALLEEGRIEPWTRSYAARAATTTPVTTTTVSPVQSAPTPAVVAPAFPCEPEGQFSLFDATTAPTVNVMQLVEEKRRRLHISQREAARQLGGLNQPGYANALREHDKLGAWRRNRALEWAAA